ncbi:unnamed protein product [Phytophthora fragariaefolia]|uniref:Unnamed protein product n=1 Tax=Phytophthora fragariaefolia TaxID=1490495 RepID=A0A9W6U252_9STRA|nr:unnamed protein product [Phytophthora fragariaefolia]
MPHFPDPVLDQGGPPAQAIPAHGATGDASPQKLRDQPQRGTQQSGDDHAASPSPPAGHPEVADTADSRPPRLSELEAGMSSPRGPGVSISLSTELRLRFLVLGVSPTSM